MVALGGGGGQRDLLHIWLHRGPMGLFRSPATRKALLGGIMEGKQEVGQHHHKSRSEMIGLFHLFYLSIYSMLSRSYRYGSGSCLPPQVIPISKDGRTSPFKNF